MWDVGRTQEKLGNDELANHELHLSGFITPENPCTENAVYCFYEITFKNVYQKERNLL